MMALTSDKQHGVVQQPLATSSVAVLRLLPHGVELLDQTQLPFTVTYVTVTTPEAMVNAIQTMVVRGAPAIGIAGAYGVVLAARQQAMQTVKQRQWIRQQAETLRQARPTAVNLMWAIDRMLSCLDRSEAAQLSDQACLAQLEAEAVAIHQEDVAANLTMGQHGAALLPTQARVLTHCNAGALATGGFGTALGVVRAAFAQGRCQQVFADETRPRQQGAKLTVWELMQDGIPVTLISDGMSASLMRAGRVDAVIVGADRIARNGDTANKIGTYTLALVAQAHNVPFYVAAPLSTFDPTLANGDGIPIEERDPAELRCVGDVPVIPDSVPVWNPAFDVTPASLITAFITEKGVFRADQLSLLWPTGSSA